MAVTKANDSRPRWWRKRLAMLGVGIVLALSGVGPTALGAAPEEDEDALLRSIRPEAIRADMRFLADDLLEGRGTGTRGHLLAARWVASQFESMGLEPAGDNGTYLQDVTLRSSQVDEANSSFVRSGPARKGSLKFREDYILYGDPGRDDSRVKAGIVFVGYGITAPEQAYDDYANVDVRGKIVAMVFGAPAFDTAVKAHYSASWLKRKNAAAHGAIGILVLYDSRLQKLYPFEKQVRDLAIPRLNWLDAAGKPNDYFATLQVYGTLSRAGVKRLLAGSGHTPEQIEEAVKSGKLPAFELPGTAEVHTRTRHQLLHSPNVVGKLEGSDQALRAEHVVYTAHLDHLGISTPVKGESIYHGALDNASGSAEVVEIARAFTRLQVRPRRSIVFIAVTGEESGLLGSDYFALNPTVPPSTIVADINIDEDLMLWPLRDVVAFGAEHSTLGKVVQQAAERLNLAVSPDPMPEQVDFIRSDQYSFVRQGVPSIALAAGVKSADPSIRPAEIFDNWYANFYHQPQDDMQQTGLNFEAAAEFARVGLLCGLYVAQQPERPSWNAGDFFGITFAGGKR
jgi:Zn-dependent M28 family amino/carboxypeptidase